MCVVIAKQLGVGCVIACFDMYAWGGTKAVFITSMKDNGCITPVVFTISGKDNAHYSVKDNGYNYSGNIYVWYSATDIQLC